MYHIHAVHNHGRTEQKTETVQSSKIYFTSPPPPPCKLRKYYMKLEKNCLLSNYCCSDEK